MSQSISEDLSFRFLLPDGLAVRGCRLEDGIPVLLFTSSPKMPTITEADLAAVLRTVYCNNTRPGFFFSTITNPGHPFLGKWVKNYVPEFTRGTDLGELLFQADWIMKCLMVGARSNKEMTNFKAWEKTSDLEGFASKLDFFPDENPTSPSVFMSCSSVEVRESEDELWFVGEPQMKIDDGSCKAYSQYITAIYDSIAYHDEPLLLKVREVPKLILLAEWLKDKHVKISESWMKKETKPRPMQDLDQRQRTYPSVRKLESKLEVLAQTLNQSSTLIPQISYTSKVDISDVVVVDDRLIKWKETTKETLPWSPATELTVTRKVTASFDDLDRVYEGVDPNMPIGFFVDIGSFMGRNPCNPPAVSSWLELSHLVVSGPRVLQPALIGFTKSIESGGVDMGNVEKRSSRAPPVKQETKRGAEPVVKHEQFQRYPDALGVAATEGKNKQQLGAAPNRLIPKLERDYQVPPRSVKAETELRRRNKAVQACSGNAPPVYGTLNSSSGEMDFYNNEGQLVCKNELLHQKKEISVYLPQSSSSSSSSSSSMTVTPIAIPYNTGLAGGSRPGQLALDINSDDHVSRAPVANSESTFPLPSSSGGSGYGGSGYGGSGYGGSGTGSGGSSFGGSGYGGSTPADSESKFSQD